MKNGGDDADSEMHDSDVIYGGGASFLWGSRIVVCGTDGGWDLSWVMELGFCIADLRYVSLDSRVWGYVLTIGEALIQQLRKGRDKNRVRMGGRGKGGLARTLRGDRVMLSVDWMDVEVLSWVLKFRFWSGMGPWIWDMGYICRMEELGGYPL